MSPMARPISFCIRASRASGVAEYRSSRKRALSIASIQLRAGPANIAASSAASTLSQPASGADRVFAARRRIRISSFALGGSSAVEVDGVAVMAHAPNLPGDPIRTDRRRIGRGAAFIRRSPGAKTPAAATSVMTHECRNGANAAGRFDRRRLRLWTRPE